MVEAPLPGTVSGLIPITSAGPSVTAYLQHRRGER
uniref:Cytochrome b6/f complex subunit V n=2 Tax=Selaginella TaxID=3246 RepID=A0A482A2K6_SELUN|nr:cytochrome b6/f complex subunit V [Selaginella uncinata]YP_009589531.1 cytochrome b6/f complex subunit V [Selaginella hainanensis]QBL07886.1 cytochrome b6/f complex subunit V [Selaginella uncinata]QBL76112.1 cytochrome b6/f complex subunit V [Selaginella hainanensis]